MVNIIVLYGGRSGEHEVSLLSAASIVRNLDAGFRIRCIGIDKQGRWHLQPAAAVNRAKATRLPLELRKDPGNLVHVVPGRGLYTRAGRVPAGLVFPVLHGTFGEDGTIQGLLEMAGLAYVGAGVLGSAVGMDKEKAKRLWQAAGLPVVPYLTIHRDELPDRAAVPAGLAAKIRRELGFPVFVKPARLGSSVGISKIEFAAGLGGALRTASRYDTKLLVEKAVSGQEIECSVMGNRSLRSFTPGEVLPSHEFYDYEAKYIDPDGASFAIPARIGAAKLRRIRRLAEAAFSAVGAEGMARVDFFIDSRTGEIFINEINTIPGFTPISMFPMMCAHDGLSYPRLLRELIRLALERFRLAQSLEYSYQ